MQLLHATCLRFSHLVKTPNPFPVRLWGLGMELPVALALMSYKFLTLFVDLLLLPSLSGCGVGHGASGRPATHVMQVPHPLCHPASPPIPVDRCLVLTCALGPAPNSYSQTGQKQLHWPPRQIKPSPSLPSVRLLPIKLGICLDTTSKPGS